MNRNNNILLDDFW